MKFIDTEVDSTMRLLMFIVLGLFIIIVTTVFVYDQLDFPSHDQKIQTSLIAGVVMSGIILFISKGRIKNA